MNFYDTEIMDKKGNFVSSEKYKGKVVIIVNTATKCGLAPQFEKLEELYQKYKEDGLEIIGIPSNTFKQESEDSAGAAEDCKINHGVTFTIMGVTDVNGENEAPVYTYLKSQKKRAFGSSRITWNFEKFLIGPDGEVYKRYKPTKSPYKMEDDIKYLLGSVK